jgi:hypothetical protein
MCNILEVFFRFDNTYKTPTPSKLGYPLRGPPEGQFWKKKIPPTEWGEIFLVAYQSPASNPLPVMPLFIPLEYHPLATYLYAVRYVNSLLLW